MRGCCHSLGHVNDDGRKLLARAIFNAASEAKQLRRPISVFALSFLVLLDLVHLLPHRHLVFPNAILEASETCIKRDTIFHGVTS